MQKAAPITGKNSEEEDVTCTRWNPEYMLKMMEVCKAQGFVYWIIPEKGKPVTGASDNLLV